MVVMVFVPALVSVVVAMSVFALVLILVFITTAMVALAQLMDVVGAHARLGNLVDDVTAAVVVMRAVNVRRIDSGPQHGTTNRRMRTGVATQTANGGISPRSIRSRRALVFPRPLTAAV